MFFGGDYNPEQWPEPVWADDIERMREAHVNLVSLGVFSWSRIQPDEGEWDFQWLDTVIGMLHDAGIGVNLATATASIPHWMVRRYPNVLPVTEDGVPLAAGSRQHYSPTSPDYRRLAAELVAHIGARYASHPGVRMWHVNNEYACHVRADYSDHATRAFREWLRVKYQDIDSLNEAWGTAFWSQRYSTFDEVSAPRRAPYSRNPAGMLDFRRFTSDSILELYVMERDLLRAAGATQPITTNFMGAFEPLDYWRWSAEVDVIANDSYPDPRDPEALRIGAFDDDLMRSLKPDTPWILMEQAPDAVNWRPSNRRKAPGQMAEWSEQAIARGAGGIMFFQWRQSSSGSEKFHSAMLPHSGVETRTWHEICKLGQSVADRDAVAPAPARVAIILDWPNWWALGQPDHPATFDYLAELRLWHGQLHRRDIPTDFVQAEQDLSAYDLIIAPALYLLSDAGALSLLRFAESGGVLVSTAFSDVVNERDAFREGGFAMQLREVFGAYPAEFSGVVPDDDVVWNLRGEAFRARVISEEIRVTSGQVLASYQAGEPALIRNEYGRGVSLHLGTFADRDAADAVLALALIEAGM